jgi:hypothetical protein
MRSALIVSLLAVSPLFAQVPAAPAVTGVPGAAAGPTATAAAGGAATGAPANIWSRLCPTEEQCQKFKNKLCASPIGQLLGGILTPYRAMTGGIIPKWCPGPLDANPADLAKPADSAEGAAARIKASEADAKKRRAAVRYLGTVDCKRFPEAEPALLNSLRGDPNECVRLEAALAFRNGCCCSKKVIETLIVVVNGEKTADPAENSPRVRCAAAQALQHCLSCFKDTDKPKPPEKPVVDPKKDAPEPGVPDKAMEPGELPPPTKGESEAALLRARAGQALARFRGLPESEEPPLAAVGVLPLVPVPISVPGSVPVTVPQPQNPTLGSSMPSTQPVTLGQAGTGPTIQVVSRPTAVVSVPITRPMPARVALPESTEAMPRTQPTPVGSVAPRSGQRSLWSLFKHAAGN